MIGQLRRNTWRWASIIVTNAPVSVTQEIKVTFSVALDAFDIKLLEVVRRDNQLTARLVGEQVGLSESAVLRRLRRLRRDGAIIGDVAVVHPELTGSALTMHVLVEMDVQARAVSDAFIAKLRARPEVEAAWDVSGATDFLVTVQVPDMAAFDAFSRDVLQSDATIRNFETMIVIRQVVMPDATKRPVRG